MPVTDVLEGHGFTASLDEQVLSLPAYQAFYARID
jgi:alpha-glucosidase